MAYGYDNGLPVRKMQVRCSPLLLLPWARNFTPIAPVCCVDGYTTVLLVLMYVLLRGKELYSHCSRLLCRRLYNSSAGVDVCITRALLKTSISILSSPSFLIKKNKIKTTI